MYWSLPTLTEVKLENTDVKLAMSVGVHQRLLILLCNVSRFAEDIALIIASDGLSRTFLCSEKLKETPFTANKVSTIIMMLGLCQHCRIIPTFYNATVEGSTDTK